MDHPALPQGIPTIPSVSPSGRSASPSDVVRPEATRAARLPRLFAGVLLLMLGSGNGALAQGVVPVVGTSDTKTSEDNNFSLSLWLTQDNFFGFYPEVRGTYLLSPDVAVAFRGAYFTDIRGVSDEAGSPGKNPMTQLDAGFKLWGLERRLAVTAMVGAVHGQVLSSGKLSSEGRGTAFEGVVPSLRVEYTGSTLEGGGLVEWYKSIRSEIGNVPGSDTGGTRDFLHWWVYGGYRATTIISVGVHYEQLLTTRDSAFPGAQRDYYRWLGGYAELKLPRQTLLRFTAGKDFFEGGDFYRFAFAKTF